MSTETTTNGNGTTKQRQPRSTPKAVAERELEYCRERLAGLRERVRGWSEDLDAVLDSAGESLDGAVDLLASAEPPPASRVGRKFHLKEGSGKYYDGLVADGEVLTVEKESARHVLATNHEGVKVSISVGHIVWVD